MLSSKFNPCTITLNAQYQLVNFYTTFGFTKIGKTFNEANIKHIKMIKEIK